MSRTGSARSGKRTFAGLALATVVAPVATVLSIEIALLFTPQVQPVDLVDLIGSAATFLVLALLFGSLFSALPTLLIGSVIIAVARFLGTNSPFFFATAGFLAGSVMAWVDTQRTQSAFALLAAIPFVVGGLASALAYWRVAER